MRFKKHGPLLLSLLLILSLLASCDKAIPDYFAYRSADFTATLEGNIGGRDFLCDVQCRGGDMEKLVFRAPDALTGLTITSDKEGLVVEKDGLRAEFSPDQLTGLLLPARLLLLEGAGLRSVQKIPEGLLLSVSVTAVSSPATKSPSVSAWLKTQTADASGALAAGTATAAKGVLGAQARSR